jgi:hypothetical protein
LEELPPSPPPERVPVLVLVRADEVVVGDAGAVVLVAVEETLDDGEVSDVVMLEVVLDVDVVFATSCVPEM